MNCLPVFAELVPPWLSPTPWNQANDLLVEPPKLNTCDSVILGYEDLTVETLSKSSELSIASAPSDFTEAEMRMLSTFTCTLSMSNCKLSMTACVLHIGLENTQQISPQFSVQV